MQVFHNERELTLLTINMNVSKVFQRLHNEGIVAESLIMDSYYENLCSMKNAEDKVIKADVIHGIILCLTEACS
jgi:hypothetical protein